MRCPFCGHPDTAVKDSRATEDNSAIRRRRYCNICSARFTTVERIQLVPLMVIKKDGSQEPFDRDKLATSIYTALHKRNVEGERIDRVINSLVRQFETMGETEVKSSVIGERVMNALSDLDPVAYIRFASVYCEFHAAQDFEAFVKSLTDDQEVA